ncbi:MAG TPA: hypothetical protein VFC26_07105, partial [Verrucomicrobiae bacterium]|nr:hypothetical protein [Verrucomicrobiae bacterium]
MFSGLLAINLSSQTTKHKVSSPARTEHFTRIDTLQVGEFAVDLCRREDGAFGLGEIRHGVMPLRRADFLITWQVDGQYPRFERQNRSTVLLREPQVTLTFVPEKRESAGTTFVGFRLQFKT